MEKRYRIIENVKNDNFYVQLESNFILFKKWITLRNDGYMLKFMKHDIYTKLSTWLIILAMSSLCFLLPMLEVNTGIVYNIFLGIFLILFLVDGLSDSYGHLRKSKFSCLDRAKLYIEEIKEEEEEKRKLNEKIKKQGKEKVVGVYVDGEFIDGDQLKRWKKLERIVDEGGDAALK